MLGDSGWPLIGSVQLMKRLVDGSVRNKSFLQETHVKYGPIAKLRAPGNSNLHDRTFTLLNVLLSTLFYRKFVACVRQ